MRLSTAQRTMLFILSTISKQQGEGATYRALSLYDIIFSQQLLVAYSLACQFLFCHCFH